MNFFQEYEQARKNPLMVDLDLIVNYWGIDDTDDFYDYFPDNSIDDSLPISEVYKIIRKNDIVYSFYDLFMSCYQEEYKQYWLDFTEESIKRMLPLIPGQYKGYFYSRQPFSVYDITGVVSNNPSKALSCFNLSFNDPINLRGHLHNTLYYCSWSSPLNDMYKETKIIQDAFLFMCDYRFIPETYKQPIFEL